MRDISHESAVGLLTREQRNKLLSLSRDSVREHLVKAEGSARRVGWRRLKEVIESDGQAEHDLKGKYMTQLGKIFVKIRTTGTLVPLLEAIDKSDTAMSIDPDKASNTIWSHALAGMSGSFLNLTLDTTRQR